MKSIHVLRKPCSEPTVAANVLRHGTGALNINECRIGAPFVSAGGNNFDAWRSGEDRTDRPPAHGIAKHKVASGRWPANLVLQHLDGCVQDGVKKMPGHKGYPNGPDGSSMQYTSSRRGSEVRPSAWKGHADPDGTETVTAWVCVEGCPVAALDAQSGFLVARGNKTSMGHGPESGSGVTGWGKGRADAPPRPDLNDGGGGASRFFKQVGGRSE